VDSPVAGFTKRFSRKLIQKPKVAIQGTRRYFGVAPVAFRQAFQIPVALFTTTISATEITLLEESLTRPLIVPLGVWVTTGTANKTTQMRRKTFWGKRISVLQRAIVSDSSYIVRRTIRGGTTYPIILGQFWQLEVGRTKN
jgi:hypothetical protein